MNDATKTPQYGEEEGTEQRLESSETDGDRDIEILKKKIEEQIKRVNPNIDKSQQRFTEVMAELDMYKNNLEHFVQQHDKLYRWVWQFQKNMTTDGEACSAEKYQEVILQEIQRVKGCLLSTGWRWMLQLKAAGRWWDWVYIQQSNRSDSHLGVFAGRDFPRGSVIGYQIGTQFVQDESSHYLFLGMHYMKSACHPFKIGSREYQAAKKNQNCFVCDDGSIQTSKKIAKNVELLSGSKIIEEKRYNCNVDNKNDERKEPIVNTKKRKVCEIN